MRDPPLPSSPLAADAQAPRVHAPPRQAPGTRTFVRALVTAVAFLAAVAAFIYWNAPRQHFRRGLAALQVGDLETVEYESAALRDLAGYDPHARLLRGGTLLRSEQPANWQQALEEFENAAEHPETRLLALTWSGEAQYRLGNFRPAKELLSLVVEEDPDNVEAHRSLGAAYFDMGAMQHALFHMRRAAELDPADPRPHWMIGSIYQDFGNLEAALESYLQALRLVDAQPPGAPDRVPVEAVRFECAEVQAGTGQFTDALQTLTKCRETADVLALGAFCHLQLHDYERAKTCFQEALRQRPNHLEALRFLGRMALGARDLETAASYLSLAAEKYPSEEEIQELLSQVWRLQGHDQQAEEAHQRAETLRQKKTALQSLQQQLAVDPADPTLRNEIGKLAIELGMPDLALRSFRASLEVNPNDPEATAALRQLLAQQRRAQRPGSSDD